MTWYPLDLPSKQGTFIKSRRLDSNNSPKKAHIWGHPAQALKWHWHLKASSYHIHWRASCWWRSNARVHATTSISFYGDVYFCFLRHNVIELNKKAYFHVGQIPSISLVHGGPAPLFFAEPVADYILYGLEVKVSIADKQDKAIKRKLQKVSDLMWFIKKYY